MELRIDDRIMFIKKGGESLTNGKVYMVLAVDKDNDPRIINDRGALEYYTKDQFKKVKGIRVMGTIKDYLNRNKDAFITVGVIALIDEFLLGGSLRERITKTCKGMLENAEKKLKGDTDEPTD